MKNIEALATSEGWRTSVCMVSGSVNIFWASAKGWGKAEVGAKCSWVAPPDNPTPDIRPKGCILIAIYVASYSYTMHAMLH